MNPRISGQIGAPLTLLVLLSFILAGCVSQRSDVATTFGYKKSVEVKAGPYQLHYGQSGSEDFVLLAESNWNMFSSITGEGTDVYLDGKPFIHFGRSPDGSLTNLQMHLPDVHGKAGITLIDKNADGQWDFKIDEVTKRVFVWKDGHWVQR